MSEEYLVSGAGAPRGVGPASAGHGRPGCSTSRTPWARAGQRRDDRGCARPRACPSAPCAVSARSGDGADLDDAPTSYPRSLTAAFRPLTRLPCTRWSAKPSATSAPHRPLPPDEPLADPALAAPCQAADVLAPFCNEIGTDSGRQALAAFLQAGQYSERLQDERILTARLATGGGPEPKAAATIALAGPAELIHEFVSVGQYVAQREVDLATTHQRHLQGLLAEGAMIAAKAHEDAWRAAEAAAKAMNATKEAAEASDKKTNRPGRLKGSTAAAPGAVRKYDCSPRTGWPPPPRPMPTHPTGSAPSSPTPPRSAPPRTTWTASGRHFSAASIWSTPSASRSRPSAGPSRNSVLPRRRTAGPGS